MRGGDEEERGQTKQSRERGEMMEGMEEIVGVDDGIKEIIMNVVDYT